MTEREIIKTLLAKKLPERVGLNESFWPFMSDHSIPPSVTVADYEYMLDLFWKHCRY